MKELIKTQVNENEEIIISGRELHEFLEIGTRYDNWFKRMVKYGFVENEDYVAIVQKRTTAQGNETTFKDHHLKLDMAKEVSMIQRSDKGRQARQYFIEKEKQYWEQLKENKRLATDNEQLHGIATDDELDKDEQKYQADVTYYSWNNIRTILENSDYKTIEDKVDNIIKFHTE